LYYYFINEKFQLVLSSTTIKCKLFRYFQVLPPKPSCSEY
ncbi:hypothetical protein BLOT_016492, partial [Blomia tropicalis]